MNDMKLIMENWRKFSDELNNVLIDETEILIEHKNEKTTLKKLNLLYENKKISKNKYNEILIESIEKDLKVLEEGVVGAAVDWVKGQASKLITKIASLIKTAAAKAIPYIAKVAEFVAGKAGTKEREQFWKTVFTILTFAAVAYIFFHTKDAQAAVKFKTIGGDALTLTKQNAGDIVSAMDQMAQRGTLNPDDVAQVTRMITGDRVLDATQDHQTAKVVTDILRSGIEQARYVSTMKGGGTGYEDVMKMAVDIGNNALGVAQQAAGAVKGAAQAIADHFGSASDLERFIGHDKQKLLQVFQELGLDPNKLNDPNMPQQFAAKVLGKLAKKPTNMNLTMDSLGHVVRLIRGG